MERNLNDEYPYGKFPTKFTKNGQQKFFEQLKNGIEEEKVSATNYPQPQVEPNTNSSTNQSSFDISKLLPLLKLMGGKKNMSTTDMLQVMLPLLGGGDVSQITEMMNFFNNKETTEEKEEDIELSSSPKIDDYVKIE